MKRTRKPSWSFVVMRGADKTVKQFHVSKRSVIAAPMAAVLAVSGCIVGLQLKAAYELKKMEEMLNTQSAHYKQTVSGMGDVLTSKDEAIVFLQQEILQLSRQAQEMNEKVSELHELELKLKLFIEKYGSTISPSSSSETRSSVKPSSALTGSTTTSSQKDSAVSTLPATESGFSATMYSSFYPNTKQIASLALHTSLNLQELSEMVGALEVSMAQTLKQADNKRMVVDANPSVWPTRSKQFTSGFGYRKDPFTGKAAFHAGIDIRGKTGDPIFSSADGIISEVGFDVMLGNYIVIDHLGGLQSAYMHLSRIEAEEGDTVVRGEKIGQLGSSGKSTGPHLHFQIMQKSEPVNPLDYLAQKS